VGKVLRNMGKVLDMVGKVLGKAGMVLSKLLGSLGRELTVTICFK
jgi:hypothetical protein